LLHGDINFDYTLMGAQGKGLQVQNRDGEWIDAIAEPDELVINVGDMLTRHTNNKPKSTIHQVVNPPRELWELRVILFRFFYASKGHMFDRENCIDGENPKTADDIGR
jgi:isopenicillin N synthase-like dioxygenase